MRWRQIIEVGTVKPTGSLDSEEWRKRSERQARVQGQIRDENARHAAKKRDLNARLARPD
jgi:hypothetical protein